MKKIKRITVSFQNTDIELIDFINKQTNVSLAFRLLCQQWIQEHGNNDVIDYLMMHSSRTSINKQTVINKSAVNKNTPTQQNSVIDQADDINDDFTKL